MPVLKKRLAKRAIVATAGLAAAGGLGAATLLAARSGGGLKPNGQSRAMAIESDRLLPEIVDVVVIGAGNIGCFTALALAERGLRVALCEKGVVAGEASGRSMGYIDSLFADPAKLPIMARSKALWRELNARIEMDVGYRQTGVAILFDQPDQVDGARRWAEAVQGEAEMDPRILSPAEAQELASGSRAHYAGAIHQPSDGIAEPQLVAPRVAQAARAKGVAVLQNCAVRGLERTAGAVSGVVTEMGRISCSAVVLAGGAWSPIFARSLGIDLPQFIAFSGGQRLAPVDGPAAALVTSKGAVMRPNLHGGVDACTPIGTAPLTPDTLRNVRRLRPAWNAMSEQLRPVVNIPTFRKFWAMPTFWRMDEESPFERDRILEPVTRMDLDATTTDKLRQEFPQIASSEIVERWSGVMTSTLDNMPYISAIDTMPGLFVGSGFYFGLTMAPAAGEALADLVTRSRPKFDLSNYRFSRFSDGSPIVFRA